MVTPLTIFFSFWTIILFINQVPLQIKHSPVPRLYQKSRRKKPQFAETKFPNQEECHQLFHSQISNFLQSNKLKSFSHTNLETRQCEESQKQEEESSHEFNPGQLNLPLEIKLDSTIRPIGNMESPCKVYPFTDVGLTSSHLSPKLRQLILPF